MIKFSTIMPMYNSEKKIRISIESIINQSYENWELIIVDDGSTDNSVKICNEYSNKDKRIKVFHQKNQGPGKARNYGISKSNGDYITFLDSDDYYERDYFKILEYYIEENNYDLVYFDIVLEDEHGKITKRNSVTRFSSYSKDELIKLQMMGILSWGPCLKVAKSDIIKQCEFSSLSVGEESLFSYKVLSRSSNIGFINKVLYHYVYNENGQHTKGGYDPWNEVVHNLKNFLNNNNNYDHYQQAVNGLALRALSISIYRFSNSNLKLFQKVKNIKKKIKEYRSLYDFNNIDKKLIDKASKIILCLINLRLYIVIIFASTLKAKKDK